LRPGSAIRGVVWRRSHVLSVSSAVFSRYAPSSEHESDRSRPFAGRQEARHTNFPGRGDAAAGRLGTEDPQMGAVRSGEVLVRDLVFVAIIPPENACASAPTAAVRNREGAEHVAPGVEIVRPRRSDVRCCAPWRRAGVVREEDRGGIVVAFFAVGPRTVGCRKCRCSRFSARLRN
jgi:hypothetical protein